MHEFGQLENPISNVVISFLPFTRANQVHSHEGKFHRSHDFLLDTGKFYENEQVFNLCGQSDKGLGKRR